MARDYKSRGGVRVRSSGRASSGAAFGLGLLCGLGIAAAAYFWVERREALPMEVRQLRDLQPHSESRRSQDDDRAAPVAPRFDFYTILPEMEVSVPEWETSSTAGSQAASAAAGVYVLQVGSFRRYEEADRTKARLALLGIESEIQRVVINGEDVWHRVRIGPYQDPKALEATRQMLAANGVDYMLLRLNLGEDGQP
jgi:cell division protein FtsN